MSVSNTDYLKCPHALAWGTTNLIFSVLEFGGAYRTAGQYDIAVATIKWALDWLVKAHVKAGSSPGDNAFVGQVGFVMVECVGSLCVVLACQIAAAAAHAHMLLCPSPAVASFSAPCPNPPAGVWQKRPPLLWPP